MRGRRVARVLPLPLPPPSVPLLLPLPCLLRLWDTYFARTASHGREATLQLHIYVCLAILEACNEELMELDSAEVLWYLRHLPTLDMDQVLTQAFNIQEDVIASGIL